MLTEILILSWRYGEQGQHYALQLTTSGLAAVVDTVEPDSAEPMAREALEEIVAEEPAEPAPAPQEIQRASSDARKAMAAAMSAARRDTAALAFSG